MGEIYRIHIGDYNKALYEYGKVISDYPNKSFYEREGFSDSLAERAKFKIGKVYRENLKDNDHALKIFNEFLSDYPNSCRKSAIYSYIAIIQEEKKDYRSEITSLEKIIEFVIDSNVQSLYFMREAVLELKPSDSAINVSDIQSEIAKRIKQKILQIQSLNIPK